MDWSDKPVLPELSTDRTIGGFRRLMTATFAGLMLIGAGVAVVSAASPDPSASTTPTTQPSDDGTTTPTESARPDHLCPDKTTDTGSTSSTG